MFTWGSRANSHQPLGGIPPMSIPELTFAAHKTMVETTSRSVLLYHNRSHFFFWRNHGPRHCEIAPAYFGANYHLPLMPLLQSPAQSTSGFSVPRPEPDQNTPAATGYRSLPGRYDPFPQSSPWFSGTPPTPLNSEAPFATPQFERRSAPLLSPRFPDPSPPITSF
jgi:hypothetical protein